MHTLKTLLVLGLATVSVAACSKKDKGKESPGGSAAGTTADKPAAPAGPFGAWDMAGRKAAFQGAWVAPGGGMGSWEAWNVEGEKITVWDGKTEVVAELTLPSPCEAVITVKSADGSSSTTHHYTIENGQIVTGLGDAGSRKGGAAVACVSNKVFTLDTAGTCLVWEQDMFDKTKYKSAPGTCSFGKDGDKEVFKATANGMETALDVHGDALYTPQIATNHAEKVADWAAAKAARDAKK